MTKRTQEQVNVEIAALEACKSYVPRYSAFRDDNHEQLDLQIEELQHGIDDTAGEWEELDSSEQDAVFEARDWKEGASDEAPSSGWNHFKPLKA
jgi:hypothetical protein